MTPDIKSSEYIPREYVVHRRDRHDCGDIRKGGGVLIAVKAELPSSVMCLDTKIELLFISIETLQGSIFLGVCYRPPSSKVDTLVKLRTSLKKVSAFAHGRLIHLLGDLNLPDINWETSTVEGNQYSAEINNMSLDIINTFGFEQQVKTPTRHDNSGTSNILDLVLTTHPSYIEDLEIKAGLSDHLAVHFTLSHKANRRKKAKKNVKMWSKASSEAIDSLKRDVLNDCLSLLDKLPNLDVETTWTEFESILILNENKYIPSKTVNPNTRKPWITRSTKRAIRKRTRAFRSAKQYGTWDNYSQKRKQAHRDINESHQLYIDNVVLSDADKSRTKFWNYIKSLKNGDGNITTLKANGTKVTEPAKVAEEFNKAFKQVFTKEDESAPLPNLSDPYPPIDEENLYAHPDQIYKLLHSLNIKKSPGPDNISPILLKTLKSEITFIMAAIFTKILQTGDIPSSFKKAHIVPIYKKDDKTNPLNYRPVSLTSLCSKLFEKITQLIIMNHLITHNILTHCQHGFRPGFSTVTQLINVIDNITQALDNNHRVDCIVTDFSKAFDVVPHSLLLLKCSNYGIRGVLLKIIENFLRGRTQQVKVDGVLSNETEVLSGVPQGTVLGPLLFLIYINDLPFNISYMAKLFADDCMLYRTVKTPADTTSLQNDLDTVSAWCEKWKMPLNILKCSVIHFSKKLNEILPQYTLQNDILKPSTDIKYLGVTLNEKMNWKTHVTNTTNKAQKVINLIKRNFYKSSSDTKILCYNTLVRPTLEYASSAWSPHTQSDCVKLENINRQAARLAFKEHRREPGTMTNLLKEKNWPTLEERSTVNRLGMLHKIMHSATPIVDQTVQLSEYQRPRAPNDQQLIRPHCRTLQRSSTFFPRSATEWNTLPQVLVDISDNKLFKRKLNDSPDVILNAISASRRLLTQ